MELTIAETNKLAEAADALCSFLDMMLEHNKITTERIVLLLNEGWEVEIINVGAMRRKLMRERLVYVDDHGHDEKRNANGE
jgi:hypothetical protein